MKKVEQFLRGAIYDKYGRYPLIWENSKDKPYTTGHSYYWTTPGGKPIYYPNAYRWPKVYHGSTITLHVGQKWFNKLLKLPKGYSWKYDSLGVKIVNSKGQDYHPHYSDILLGPKHLVKELKECIIKRKHKIQKDKERNRYINMGLRVLLEDSKRAGNCVQGTINFAKQNDIFSPDLSVSAKILQKLKHPSIERVIDAAIERSTLTCI